MIAFLINELDIRGGTHKQFLKLLEYTAARTDNFFIVTKRVDFDKTYPGFKAFENKIRIFTSAKRGRGKLHTALSIRRDIKSLRALVKDADVINIHDQGFELLLPAFKNKKTVWQINDLHPSFSVGCNKDEKTGWRTKVIKRIIAYNCRYIDRFTVNVSKNKERIYSAFKRDADVLYCGIEPVGISRAIDLSLSRFKDKKLNLLSSGVFFPYRNYETQVEVVRLLADSGIDVHLNIIGSTDLNPDYSQRIRNLIKETGLEQNITICGMVDEDTFRQLHEDADMFMFINIDQSWGLAVFEAMSCRLPVIVSESVGATEILTDGANALFVKPTDASQIAQTIKKLMQDTGKYLALCEAGEKFHENYTWDKAYSSPMYSILTNGKSS